MTRGQATETLLKLKEEVVYAYENNQTVDLSMYDDEFIEDLNNALEIAIADMGSLQDVISCVDGLLER